MPRTGRTTASVQHLYHARRPPETRSRVGIFRGSPRSASCASMSYDRRVPWRAALVGWDFLTNAFSSAGTCRSARQLSLSGAAHQEQIAPIEHSGIAKRNITMPVPSHTKAAEHHTNAAAEHKAAADLHGKGEHAAALEKSNKAHGTGDAAQKASTDAHGKSSAHAKK